MYRFNFGGKKDVRHEFEIEEKYEKLDNNQHQINPAKLTKINKKIDVVFKTSNILRCRTPNIKKSFLEERRTSKLN